MKSRRGSTLIEVLLSMSAGSVVLLLAISLVHQTFVITQTSRHREDHQRTLDRIAHAFRYDVHLASSTQSTDRSTLSILCADGSQLTYKAKGNLLLRERKSNGQITESERFVLSEDSTMAFQCWNAPDRAGLQIQSETGLVDRPTKSELTVEASVGRWKSIEGTIQVSP